MGIQISIQKNNIEKKIQLLIGFTKINITIIRIIYLNIILKRKQNIIGKKNPPQK